MQKVISNVIFVDESGECTYAVMFAGAMDEEFLYAKKASATGAESQDSELIKISRKDLQDTTANWHSCWKGPIMDIVVPDELGLNDPRIKKESDFQADIVDAIESVMADIRK